MNENRLWCYADEFFRIGLEECEPEAKARNNALAKNSLGSSANGFCLAYFIYIAESHVVAFRPRLREMAYAPE